MNLMAPELNNKQADEYSEKNSLTGLGSMDKKNQSKDVSVKEKVNDLELIDSWLKEIEDRDNNNIALRQTGSEKNNPILPKEKERTDSHAFSLVDKNSGDKSASELLYNKNVRMEKFPPELDGVEEDELRELDKKIIDISSKLKLNFEEIKNKLKI